MPQAVGSGKPAAGGGSHAAEPPPLPSTSAIVIEMISNNATDRGHRDEASSQGKIPFRPERHT